MEVEKGDKGSRPLEISKFASLAKIRQDGPGKRNISESIFFLIITIYSFSIRE